MLTVSDRVYIEDRLLWVASATVAPRLTLIAHLDQVLKEKVGEGEPLVLVRRVLELCIADAYQRTPPALIALLEGLLATDPRVVEIVERIRQPPPASPSPLDSLVLYSKLPFLERQTTRRAVQTLLLGRPSQPVVVINGGPKSGKTHTGEYINHVLFHNSAFKHCLVEIVAEQGVSVGAGELAKELVSKISRDIVTALTWYPKPNTNGDAWAQELANWIIGEANQSGKWWFVLDGFNARELRDDTRRLIVKLARSLTNGRAAELHRLILIDFDRSVLTLPPGLIAVETTGPIQHASIKAALSLWLKDRPPNEIGAIIAKVVEDLDDPVADLPELGARLGNIIVSLDATP